MNEIALPTSVRERIAAIPREALLRAALLVDAAVTGLNAVAYVLAAGAIDGPLGLDQTLLRVAGVGLIAFALLVLAIANRDPIPRAGSLAVALANVAWVIASVAALVSGALDPTTGGAVWVIAQALVVEAFATVQLYARSGSAR